MNQTPLKPSTHRRLADLNDQLGYFLFLETHFSSTLRDLPDEVRAESGSEVFPDNRWSDLIDFPLDHYPLLQEENKKHTFGSYFSACYEVVGDYLISVLRHVAEVNGWDLEAPRNLAPEEYLFRSLERRGLSVLADELEYSLRYCRLRRNHWSHLRECVSQAMSQILRYHGDALNEYWDQKEQVDFSSEDVGSFGSWETIELIAVLRATFLRVDSALSSQLDHEALLMRLAGEIWEDYPHRRGREHIDQRAGILCGRVWWEYATEVEMDRAVEVSESVQDELG